jgi:hypothetical protein
MRGLTPLEAEVLTLAVAGPGNCVVVDHAQRAAAETLITMGRATLRPRLDIGPRFRQIVITAEGKAALEIYRALAGMGLEV